MTKKLGLVLEGGGGKGAYQMGALKAFAERGLRFDCVAGTSVGGLNAGLWATDKLPEGENLWFNISQDKIYPWRRPRWFGRLLMCFLVPLNVIVNYVRGTQSLPTGRNCKIAVRLVLVLLVALMALVGYFTPGVFSFLCFAVAMIMVQVFVFYNNQGYVGAIIGSYAGMPIFALLMLALFKVSESIRDLQVRTLVLVVCLLGLPLVAPYLTRLAFAFIKWIGAHLLSQSFLNNLPLRREVALIMRDAAFQMPVYVAAAQPERLIDPDDMYSVPSALELAKMIGSGSPHRNPHRVPFAPRRFVPTYLGLREFRGEELVDALMATAALPIGIVQSVRIRGRELVDGGIADNRIPPPEAAGCGLPRWTDFAESGGI